MTRFTLLATAATLAAAPAFAQDQSDGDMSVEETNPTDQSDQTMAGGSNAAGQGGDAMIDGYGSGTMDSSQLENMIRTSNIVGGDVYAADREDQWSDSAWTDLEFVEGVEDNWENVGNITDVVLSPDGRQVGLIVSHGGFLDIADDTVLLTMDQIRRIGTVDALDGDFNYVTRMTEEQIEAMPEVEENWY